MNNDLLARQLLMASELVMANMTVIAQVMECDNSAVEGVGIVLENYAHIVEEGELPQL